jgi:uncharacterized protein with HEPN domain
MKSSYKDSQIRLEHIRKAITEIEIFVDGKTVNIFCENTMLHSAVMMQFMIMGEAIIHVDKEISDKYNYPWYKVRSFRNMIAHEYFNIKLSAVWEVIEQDLPLLKLEIRKMLDNEF